MVSYKMPRRKDNLNVLYDLLFILQCSMEGNDGLRGWHLTQAQVAALMTARGYPMSQARVSAIEHKAIRKIRAALEDLPEFNWYRSEE